MASIESSRNFWDEKAKENPIWYVSSYGPYYGRDEADFWRSGFSIWEQMKRQIGCEPRSEDIVVEIGSGVADFLVLFRPKLEHFMEPTSPPRCLNWQRLIIYLMSCSR